jgi:hypothetical protein
VSDTLGAALWGAELMFQIVAKGGAGINFHTANTSVYTPITRVDDGRYHAQPLYYGMLAFTQACRGVLVSTQLAPRSDRLAAFAAREEEKSRVTLINKSVADSVCVRVDPGQAFGVLPCFDSADHRPTPKPASPSEIFRLTISAIGPRPKHRR